MPVTALRVRCDYLTRSEYAARLDAMGFPADGREQALADFDTGPSFTVTVAAVLADGREVPWRTDRGFSTTTSVFGEQTSDPWATLSAEQLAPIAQECALSSTVADARADRAELAQILAAHQVEVVPDALADLPVEVRLSDRLRDRLTARPKTRPPVVSDDRAYRSAGSPRQRQHSRPPFPGQVPAPVAGRPGPPKPQSPGSNGRRHPCAVPPH